MKILKIFVSLRETPTGDTQYKVLVEVFGTKTK